MPIKKRKNENFEKRKNAFFLMSQASLKIRFLSKGMPYRLLSHGHTDGRTDGRTDTQTEWLLRAPLQGFRISSFNLSSRIGPSIFGTMWENTALVLNYVIYFVFLKYQSILLNKRLVTSKCTRRWRHQYITIHTSRRCPVCEEEVHDAGQMPL